MTYRGYAEASPQDKWRKALEDGRGTEVEDAMRGAGLQLSGRAGVAELKAARVGDKSVQLTAKQREGLMRATVEGKTLPYDLTCSSHVPASLRLQTPCYDIKYSHCLPLAHASLLGAPPPPPPNHSHLTHTFLPGVVTLPPTQASFCRCSETFFHFPDGAEHSMGGQVHHLEKVVGDGVPCQVQGCGDPQRVWETAHPGSGVLNIVPALDHGVLAGLDHRVCVLVLLVRPLPSHPASFSVNPHALLLLCELAMPLPPARRDVIQLLEPWMVVATRSFCAAVHHYFRYDEACCKRAGETLQEWESRRAAADARVAGRRADAKANLLRFARLLEKNGATHILTANLHTLVCRLADQEVARGATCRDLELWVERGVGHPPHPQSTHTHTHTHTHTK